VVEILADLASNGKTVILSIHQPRYTVFKLFDILMLLAEGEMVYQVRCCCWDLFYSSFPHTAGARPLPLCSSLSLPPSLPARPPKTSTTSRTSASKGEPYTCVLTLPPSVPPSLPQGPATMGLAYFSHIGFNPPSNENACDFFMDVVRREGGREGGREESRGD